MAELYHINKEITVKRTAQEVRKRFAARMRFLKGTVARSDGITMEYNFGSSLRTFLWSGIFVSMTTLPKKVNIRLEDIGNGSTKIIMHIKQDYNLRTLGFVKKYRNALDKLSETIISGFSENEIISREDHSVRPREDTARKEMTPRQMVFAMILILALILGFSFYTVKLLDKAKLGIIDHVSVLDNNILIHFDKQLHHLSSSGHYIRTIKLSSFGIKGIPQDIQILGSGDFLVGNNKYGTIEKCDIKTRKCEFIAPENGLKLGRPFKFIADEKENLLYIVDIDNHRLLMHDIHNRETHVLSGADLKYPNDIKIGKDGLLYVANTNRHRISVLERDGNSIKEITYFKGENPFGRSGRTWPIAVAQSPTGDWWALNADSMMKESDLIIYNGQGEALRRVPLDNGIDPIDIAWAGDKLILTEYNYCQVFSLSSGDEDPIPFGDPDFQAAVIDFRTRKLSK